MADTEWNVVNATHQIRAVRTDSGGARLYVDGELLDVTNDLYASGEEATLVGTFGDNDVVEAVLQPSAEAAIRVNRE